LPTLFIFYSLHPSSVNKIFGVANSASANHPIIVFQPSLTVTSELSLPPYPILAYLYPKQLSHIWQSLKAQLDTLNDQKSNLNNFFCVVLSELSRDEQLHYFADHYGKVNNPSYVRVIVGNGCNLKCVMCPYHSPQIKPFHTTEFFQRPKTLSWDIMQRLAKDSGKIGATVLIGSIEEPLLHSKIVDFIQLCRQEGVPKVHLTTNGQLLNKDNAIKLLQAGLTSIDISIDAATPDTYLKIRGSNFYNVESNVLNFIEIRDKQGITCEVRTSLVRNPEISLEEEKEFINSWLSKVNCIFILNRADYESNNMRLNNVNTVIEKKLKDYQDRANGRWPCSFPFIEMTILPDGRIYYCIETLFRLGFDSSIESLGNYHQQTLEEIWCGDLFQQLRRDLILNHLEKRVACQDCDMWKSQVIHREVKNGYSVIATTITEIYQNFSL
jgi:MoaA/NifB/PqqE/SkfB family radical SAM enzyme